MLPEIGGQRAEFLRDFARTLRIIDRRFDFAAMADNAGVQHKPLHVARTKTRDALEIKTRESLAKRVALAENRPPAQARLEAFQTDLLEQSPIVGHGKAPFAVVIADIERIFAGPAAAVNRIVGWSTHRKAAII